VLRPHRPPANRTQFRPDQRQNTSATIAKSLKIFAPPPGLPTFRTVLRVLLLLFVFSIQRGLSYPATYGVTSGPP